MKGSVLRYEKGKVRCGEKCVGVCGEVLGRCGEVCWGMGKGEKCVGVCGEVLGRCGEVCWGMGKVR